MVGRARWPRRAPLPYVLTFPTATIGPLTQPLMPVTRPAVLFFASAALVWAGEWTGTLNRKLDRAPDTRVVGWPTAPCTGLPFPCSPADKLYQGFLELRRFDGDKIRVSAVEPPAGPIRLYVDLNGDGRLDAGESFRFRPARHDPRWEQEATVEVPLKAGPFRSFKVRFLIPRRGKEDMCSGYQRAVLAESEPLVTGQVRLEGRKLRVAWYYSAERGEVTFREGLDANLDGRIDFDWSSPENDFYGPLPPVFRVGQRYYRTENVDPAAGRFRLVERPAKEYDRIELVEGQVLQKFTFVDFEGAKHTSREYLGRWLLIHYWEYPCTPCFADFPAIRRAWEGLRPRGLEILGVNPQPFGPGAIQAASENRAVWPQARGESLEDLTHRLRISASPTLFLLDPEGRIAVVDRWPSNLLRGEQLLRTLQAKLPLAQGE